MHSWFSFLLLTVMRVVCSPPSIGPNTWRCTVNVCWMNKCFGLVLGTLSGGSDCQFSRHEVHLRQFINRVIPGTSPKLWFGGLRKGAKVRICNTYPNGFGCRLPSDLTHRGNQTAPGAMALQSFQISLDSSPFPSVLAASPEDLPDDALSLELWLRWSVQVALPSLPLPDLFLRSPLCCRSGSCCSSGATWEQHNWITPIFVLLWDCTNLLVARMPCAY